jgi:hypothetical protein
MRRTKITIAALACALVAIAPTAAFAAGGQHQRSHPQVKVYKGKVAAATSTSPLTVTLKHNGPVMSFALGPKTRYVVNHQRLSSEPSFTLGEPVMVKARERANGTFIARIVRARSK